MGGRAPTSPNANARRCRPTRGTDKETSYAPGPNATLAEHRRFLANAGGWGPRIDIQDVIRHGGRAVDELEIELTNGLSGPRSTARNRSPPAGTGNGP